MVKDYGLERKSVIDRRKILGEIEQLKAEHQKDTVENKLLTAFEKYIRCQKTLSESECLFRLRMRRIIRTWARELET